MTTATSTPTLPTTSAAPIDRAIAAAAVVAPPLMVVSSVAWMADAAEPRAILQFWAMVGFAFVFVGLSRRLAGAAPAAASAVLVLGVIGAAGGLAFATEVAFVEHFGIERLNAQDTAATFLMLRLPGLLFPLSLLASAVLLWRHRILVTGHAALLAAGAICFPLSRIGEVAGLAVAADGLLALAIVPLGVSTLRTATDPTNA